jgi:hypothetical protein
MDEAILVGSFTLAGVLIAGLIDYLIRRGDRDAAERLQIQEQEARREERQAADRERWRETGAPVWAKARSTYRISTQIGSCWGASVRRAS